MERDFMGLAVKQEVIDVEPIDPAPLRTLAMQWPFSNNVSSHHQYLSYKGAQEDNPKTGFNSLASTGLVTITTTEAINSSHRPYSGVAQKNMTVEKQGGTHYTVTSYPPHHFDVHSIHRSHEVRVPPVVNPNHHISVSMSTPRHQHPSGRVLAANPISIAPPSGAVVGSTDLRSAPKTSTAPAQLTIFYAGSVCVYDNISPEKAQAIMLLAGNAPPITPTATSTPSPVQASIPMSSAVDSFVANQYRNTTSTPSPIQAPIPMSSQVESFVANQYRSITSTTSPVQAPIRMSSPVESFVANQYRCTTPTRSGPISITSRGGSQSARVCSKTNDVIIIKSIGGLTSPSNKAETSKVVSSVGSLIPSAVPQARKASLARFLEKRKERVLSASPYPSSKETPECSTPMNDSRSFSMNSSGSCPLPASN